MALETGTYISDLVSTNPAGTDTLDKADDHLRLIKSTVKATFPNISGAVTPTHTELNYVDGVTSAIQTQLDSKSPLASPTFTGTPAAPTAAVDTNTTQLATTAYVVGQGYAKLVSPTFTGTPAAPTAAVDTNTTQLATTAYVVGQGYLKSSTATSTYAPLASPALTGTPTAPTPTAGDNDTSIATTAFVTTAVAAGGGSMTLLGTATTTSGNTQTISSLTLTSYKALYVVIKAVSLSAVNIAGWVGFEGSTGSRLTATNSGLAAGDTVSGFAYIDLLAANYYGVSAWSTVAAGTAQASNATPGAQALFYGKHGMTTASTSIVFGPGNGTLTFDAGSIDVYGVK